MLEVVPPALDTDQEHEEGDPNPCPEDEEFFKGPAADSMEEAISKFLDGLEGQEHSGFKDMLYEPSQTLCLYVAPIQNMADPYPVVSGW